MKGFLIWLLLVVILPIVVNLLTNDLSEVSPWWASNLIRFGARFLPEGWQRPYELRWLARIDALQGRGMKLLLAIWPLMLAIAVASLGLLLALIRRALL